MSKNQRPEARDARDTAAEFVVDDEAPSRADNERFLRWVSDSPENLREYLQNLAVWEALAEPSLIDLGSPSTGRGRFRSLRRTAALALAASVLLVAGWLTWHLRESVTYSTTVGEVASFQLEDRSVVFMNAASRLTLDYTAYERRLVLHSGEASFEVASDPRRPFVVESGTMTVMAIGTEFVVRRDPAKTTVTVLEGRVVVAGDFDLPSAELSTASPETTERWRVPLGAKQRLEVEDSRRISLTAVESHEAASWRQRRLVFDAERLEEIAAEFNRFNIDVIRIEDPALQELRISGVFEANDPESLLTFLEASQGAVVQVDPDGTFRVRREAHSER